MEKGDKENRRSFDDMSAERESEVKASLEAASDRMADAQGEAMLANIKKRTDEVKGEKERKRNYHLLQQAAIRENENSRVKNTSVNVGAPQAPLNFEPEEISDNADRTFKRSMNKNQYGVRKDLQKRGLEAETEAAIAASDRIADRQAEDVLANINSLIAKRERDIAENRAAAERRAKYLSDQRAAINANKKSAETPATPARSVQKKAEVPGKTEAPEKPEIPEKTDVPGETENVRNGRAARAANYDANSTQEKPATPASSENAEAEAESRAAAGRAARAAKYEENGQTEQTATPAGGGKEQTEVPEKTDIPGDTDVPGDTEVPGKTEKPAAATAPMVHNAEERFKKNVESVKENLKYEHINQLIKEIEALRDKNKVSEKDEKKQKRWEKAAQIIAGILDGVQSVSNIVFAAKGIHPFNMNKTVSGDIQGRLSQFNKDFEGRMARYLELSEKAAALRQDVQKMKDEEERQKAAQALAKAKFEAEKNDKARNYGLDYLKFLHGQKIDNETLGLKKKGLEHTIENNKANRAIAQQNANANTKNADANASRAATFARNGGGGTRYEFDGKTYGNVHAYEAAIKQKAIQLGIPLKEDYEVTDALGNTRTFKRDKKIDQLLAEVNEKLAAQGGGRVNKGGKGKGY